MEHLLHVQVKDSLRKLARQGRIRRTKVGRRWVHFSADSAVHDAQQRARHVWESQPTGLSFGAGGRMVPDELQAAIVLFCSLLDERHRRLRRAGVPQARPRR